MDRGCAREDDRLIGARVDPRGALFLYSPHIPDRRRLFEVLTDMDAELVVPGRREKPRTFKQAMMQELRSAATRLV